MSIRIKKKYALVLINVCALLIVTSSSLIIYSGIDPSTGLFTAIRKIFPIDDIDYLNSQRWPDVILMISLYTILLLISLIALTRPSKKGYRRQGVALFISFINFVITLLFAGFIISSLL